VEIFDISQTLKPGMAVWPGDPEFLQEPVLRIVRGDVSNLMAIRMGTHTGTHIDAPLHVADSGTDAAGIPLRNCFGPARVLSIAAAPCIRASDLLPLDWRGVERVLFKTASAVPGAFNPEFIYLAEDASAFLAGKGMLLVGTDAPSVDPFESRDLPSHRILTGNGTAILEGIRLNAVLPGDYSLVCLPLKIAGADGSPVRAILWR
jgi:arylformamidase